MEDGPHGRHDPKVIVGRGPARPGKNNINFPLTKKTLLGQFSNHVDENCFKHCPSLDNDDALTDPQSRDSSCSSTPELPNTPDLLSDPYQVNIHLSNELGKDIYDIREFGSVVSFVNNRIECGFEPGSFLVTNLSPIIAQLEQWKDELPMVEPFYAVKCNPDPVILRLLARYGCSFDCATMGEIDMVLNGLGDDLSFGPRGLAKSGIVYANPAKMEHMLRFAMENEVSMTVFDGEDELHKIAALGGHKMELLLRLTTDDKASICRFSKKFGCPVEEAPKLLKVAKSLGLTVAGVSFHVGSGCGDADAYVTALSDAQLVFAAGEALGMPPMHIVDIGGGFPGDRGGYGGPGMPTFQDLAAAVRRGIDSLATTLTSTGRDISEIRFIAEPGRYFVSACTSTVTKIYSRKGGASKYQALYVDDGVYGSFNTVVYDHAHPIPQRLNSLMGKPNEDRDEPMPR